MLCQTGFLAPLLPSTRALPLLCSCRSAGGAPAVYLPEVKSGSPSPSEESLFTLSAIVSGCLSFGAGSVLNRVSVKISSVLLTFFGFLFVFPAAEQSAHLAPSAGSPARGQLSLPVRLSPALAQGQPPAWPGSCLLPLEQCLSQGLWLI